VKVWLVIMVVAGAVGGGSWPTYRSARGGYTIHHPPHWTATTLHPAPGVVYTTLAPPAGDPAIHVYTYPGHGPGSDDVLPDVACHRVRIAGVHGRRCRSLMTGTPVTILSTAARTYRISTDPGIDRPTYDRVVRSFRLIHRRAG
jgi:hypothetical protein